MTKSKPCLLMMSEKLEDWFTSCTTELGVLAFSFGGEYLEQVVRQKLIRLGLLKEEEGQSEVAPCPTSSKLELSD